MSYRILATNEYEESLSALEKYEQYRVEQFIHQIAENAAHVGKPLRYPFFREKKFNGKRLYFLVYSEWNIVLLARISNKKQQPEAIEWILHHLSEFKQFVELEMKKIT